MIVEQMIEAATKEIKENLERFCQESAQEPLSLEGAEMVGKGIRDAVAAAGRAAFTTYLMANEESKDIIVVNGETFRFKEFTNKTIISIFGKTSLSRKPSRTPPTPNHIAPWTRLGEWRMSI